jgi:fused signal recognition particle receptor
MFKFLKEKIGGWIKSFKGEKKPTKKEKAAKAKKEKVPKKKAKKGKTEIKLPMKFEVGREKFEPDIEKLKEISEEKLEEKEAEVQEEIIEAEKKEEKKGFFARIKGFFTKVKITEDNFDEIFQGLEMVLLENNVAYQVVEEIRAELKAKLVGKEIRKNDNIEKMITSSLKEVIDNILIEPFDLIEKIKTGKKPYVIVFFGINGSGKTTSIAKLAHLLKKNKISSVIAAADTFRAASIEQLEIHGKKVGVEVIKQTYGADPAAVGFDAVKHAESRNIDVVLIDTAGRMHTKENLMREMEKIVRVVKPDLKIFIAEAITGNDVTEQAKIFNESVGIDGIILSKADIDEKGGAMLSVGYITRNPIIYLGVGQGYNDLEKFDRKKFLASLGL